MKKKREQQDISFLGRFVLFFRSVSEKIRGMRFVERLVSSRKAQVGYEGESSPREAGLAFGFDMARLCSVTVLCVLLAIVLLFGGSIISYENVYYMFKDIGYISSFSESRPSILSYSEPVSNQSFSSFKNGLAVVSDSEIKFFTSTGRATLTQGSSYTNPKIVCSDASALVYDQGRHSFSVYNSFISVYSETLEYPISYAHMSDDGSFCVVTRSSDYGSVVRIYDNKFRLESEYFKNDYVISAELSPNGRFVAVLSLDASGGESKTTLNVLKRGARELYSSEVIDGEMPYRARFIANDRIALICAESASVYDAAGKRKGLYVYPDTLSHVAFAENGFALILEDNSVSAGSLLTVFDRNGNLKFAEKLDSGAFDVALFGDHAYVLCGNALLMINTIFGGVTTRAFSAENAGILAMENGDVMICTSTAAYSISEN